MGCEGFSLHDTAFINTRKTTNAKLIKARIFGFFSMLILLLSYRDAKVELVGLGLLRRIPHISRIASLFFLPSLIWLEFGNPGNRVCALLSF